VKPDHAQTNLQLYNQLTSLGWDEPALVLVRDAYGLASQLFSGQVRPTGKTFISHLVGTASVLASVGEDPTVVTAGLLHAAYAQGEFGDGSRGFSPHKRRTLVEVAGTDAECLVTAYTHTTWHPSMLAGLAANLDAELREVVLIRLANEVDDWADGGLRYYASDPAWRASLDQLKAIADRLGVPLMAEALQRAGAFDASVEVPAVLVRPTQASYLLPPRSYRPRLIVATRSVLQGATARRIISAARRWARRFPLARPVRDLIVPPGRRRGPTPR
jgi:hypothetical protein